MNPNISFETALQLLTMAYVASVMPALLVSQIGLAVIETFEAADLFTFTHVAVLEKLQRGGCFNSPKLQFFS